MSPSIRIATRFLIAKKRSMIMSLCGISFGVGFFIVTLAQVSGFEEFFIKTILGTDGAIRVQDKFQDTSITVPVGTSKEGAPRFYTNDRGNRRYVEGVEHPDRIIDAVQKLSNVAAASPVMTGSVLIQSALRKDNGKIYGIDIQRHIAVSELENQILFGSVEGFSQAPTGILLGKNLADRVQARVGDSVLIEAVSQRLRFQVSGIFETGVSDIDGTRIFMHLSAARSLLKRPHGVNFIQVALFDRDQAVYDAFTIERMTKHTAKPWQNREKSWLEVFRALKISGALTVSSIILISGLGMFNTLAMIVMEKTREIAILRSMGYTRRDISGIFLWQGGIVLICGTALGFLIGLGLTYGISSMPLRIRGIFSTDSFVVNWELLHYAYAALTATAVVFFSSILPARRAARLIPGDVIRGTAT